MSNRTLPLTFGAPLDRDTGIAAPPGSMRDLRNVLLRSGRVEARRGMTATLTGLTVPDGPAVTHTVCVQALRAESTGIVVGYAESDRSVHAWKVQADGTEPVYLGEWFTVHEDADTPPRVIGCESYGRVFLAHDEQVQQWRARTAYHEPLLGDLRTLRADWATGTNNEGDEGDDGVRFRGVVPHLAYLVGWGFADNAEIRPEIVRISLPGANVSADGSPGFKPEHYVIAGQRGEPVTCCAPAGQQLLLAKGAESYALVGSDRRTFGVVPADTRFGCAGGRLAVNVGGALYLWTLEGPGVSEGGPLTMLDLPLDLSGPEPADLVASGEVEDGFAVYVPERRLVLWIFGRRVYCLSLEGATGWSYWELGAEARCGALLYETAGMPAVAPTGWPRDVEARDVEDDSAVVHWVNHKQQGDESVEIHLRPSTGDWYLAASVPVQLTSAESHPVSGLPSGTTHDAALRYMRGTLPAVDYESQDPADWPARSNTGFTTELAGSTATTATWQRTSETAHAITLTWPDADEDASITVERRTGGGSYQQIASLPAGTGEYADGGVTVEMLYDYRVSFARPDRSEGRTLSRWAGPDAPVSFVQIGGPSYYRYEVGWGMGVSGARTRIEDDSDCFQTFAHRLTTDPDVTQSGNLFVTGNTELQPDGSEVENGHVTRARHELTHFGTTDRSEWVSRSITVLIGSDDTEYGQNCGGSGGGGGGGEEPVEPE